MKNMFENTIKYSIFIMVLGVCLAVTPLTTYSITANNLNRQIMNSKKCIKCGEVKSLDSFYKRSIQCVICMNKRSLDYNHSINGLISRIYSHQKENSIKRKHNLPTYTKFELEKWILSQPNFKTLFDNWEKSNYSKNLIPSVDRLNDYKGYSLDNIQLMTWIENKNKAHKDVVSGKLYRNQRKIKSLNLKTNEITNYYSISQACKIFNVTDSWIISCCKEKKKTIKGHVFRYINDDFPKDIKVYLKRKSSMSDYSKSKMIKVIQLTENNIFVKEHKSITDASNYVNGSDANIIRVCKNKSKTSMGFKWMYKTDYERRNE